MIDIAIITVPGTLSRLPPAAPAILKASVQEHGFTCTTLDYNAEFYREVSNFSKLETYFATGINTEEQPQAQKLIEKWTIKLLELSPRFVGISVFTYQNRIATELFCESLRKFSKTVKIILGGQGLSDGGIQGKSGFGKKLYDKGLADFWIRSEGEISLVELLKNNTQFPGINSDSFQQVDNLDLLPFPDYSDYDLNLYSIRALPITGSRGCVRSCTFCDIHEHWKYRYRSGESMAAEIVHISKKHEVTQFMFSDSLVNGNFKEFNKFVKLLADFNKDSEHKITWSSQFIIRAKNQINNEYWKNIKDSGAARLFIGVETGSDAVRNHMNKRFTNADLDYTMAELQKYEIPCTFMMIVGYPTETEKDFQDTLDMFTRYKSLANTVIVDVNIGSTLGILPGTPLYHQAKSLNIEVDTYETNWVAFDNPDLTFEKRLLRRQQLLQHVLDCGYNVATEDSNKHMMQLLADKLEIFNKRTYVKKMIRIKQNSRQDNNQSIR